MQKIQIFDTTLRDGEQSPGVNLNKSEKFQIAKQLERFNIDIMEAGFPASSKGDFESVKEISNHVRGCSVTGLSRCKQSDIDVAWEALQGGAEPRIHLFLATSPIHMASKLKMTEDQVIERAVESVQYAAKFFPHIQWSAEDACRTELPFLAKIVEKVIRAGASVINIPDTVGFITPKEYGEVFRYLKTNVPNIENVILSTHCHDDLGMAVANSLAGVEHGARQVEGTINGIGERAGNASLEEFAVALHVRKDYYQCGTELVLAETKRTSDLVSKLTGMQIPANKAVVGRNAFAHESGIHQDGMLKNKQTYEIISPELVGVTADPYVLGKLSGRHAFKTHLQKLGFSINDEEMQTLFTAFKSLCDTKKEVTDDDIIALVTDNKLGKETSVYELKSIQVNYGTNDVQTATITLTHPDGTEQCQASTGAGSVEAIYNTIETMLDVPIALYDYRIQSVGGGRDALAEVYVTVDVQNHRVSGRSVSQDVLEASAKAYISAVNRGLVRTRLAQEEAQKA
ncbi:2-isopropylmalate synthase [Aureibacillus halotolerans]|uniref:2-isopropylmalate synthase n=1 Tax=Aureibacillus halotolerans TaxID=1508390 RepID=UPI00105C182F|nr:2-isopropylmalate synthase [Aureibacillus halotolerans]